MFLGIGRVVHFLLWSGLALASVAQSAPQLYRAIVAYSLQPAGPLHSTDSFLNFAAGSPHASNRLISLFQSLSADQPILIITNGADPRSCNIGMTIAYLAAPHAVRFIELENTRAENKLSALNPKNFAAVAFCRVDSPSWLSGGQHFGTGLEIVPLAGNEAR